MLSTYAVEVVNVVVLVVDCVVFVSLAVFVANDVLSTYAVLVVNVVVLVVDCVVFVVLAVFDSLTVL